LDEFAHRNISQAIFTPMSENAQNRLCSQETRSSIPMMRSMAAGFLATYRRTGSIEIEK
jgi:hypothetical protein